MSILRDFDRQPSPIHPGEMLREEFMVPLGLTPQVLAECLHVPARDIEELVNERREIDGDMAYRLSTYFGMSVYFWMSLQSQYQMSLAYQDKAEQIKREIQPREAALEW